MPSPAHARKMQIAQEMAELQNQLDDFSKENKLVMLMDFERFELVKELMTHKDRIVWCMRLARAADDAEKEAIETEMAATKRGTAVLNELKGTRTSARDRYGLMRIDDGGCSIRLGVSSTGSSTVVVGPLLPTLSHALPLSLSLHQHTTTTTAENIASKSRSGRRPGGCRGPPVRTARRTAERAMTRLEGRWSTSSPCALPRAAI